MDQVLYLKLHFLLMRSQWLLINPRIMTRLPTLGSKTTGLAKDRELVGLHLLLVERKGQSDRDEKSFGSPNLAASSPTSDTGEDGFRQRVSFISPCQFTAISSYFQPSKLKVE